MKTMKKLFALTLAMMMVFSLALSANAANLTVENALDGAEYTLYKMATAQKNDTTGSVIYYSADGWESFWADIEWVTYNETTEQIIKNDDPNDAQMVAAAKDAKAYAIANNITGTVTQSGSFTGVDDGYYLMTSSKGSLCTMITFIGGEDTTINEKNKQLPNVTKTVDDSNVAIGDEVTFTLSIETGENHNNEMNYVIHDTMTDGLELQEDTIVVQHGNNTLNLNTDYTIDKNCADNCTFAIVFTDKLNTAEHDTITVTYNATVTDEIDTTATNTASIKDSTSPVTVTTTSLTLNKTDGTNLLGGAEFELYSGTTTGEGENAVTTYTQIPVVKDGDDYRPAVGNEQGQVIKAEDGTATVKGLDLDLTYYVKETKAPEGYVMINDYKLVTNGTVEVVNVKGEELPETGGMGTTLLYVMGGLMVAGAAVLLITKKRMGAM